MKLERKEKWTNRRPPSLREMFPIRKKDSFMCMVILLGATLVCLLLWLFESSDINVALVFELAVVMVSRFTTGYFYGLLASFVSMFAVNYIFTYPYFAFNFTLAGYPLTFLVMLTVSIIVSTLTTQIKRQEQLRTEVEKEKMRANLLRAVSHDIRTPLTSIVGGADVIIDAGQNLDEDTKRELLTSIRTEAQWLVGVVENLLSVTRISGASKIKKELEAVEEVVSGAAVKFQRRYPQIKVQICAPQELLMIPMDAILIEQVLINLMENSVLHGKTTSEIRISVHKEEHNAVFEVIDNGQGISEDVLPDIFSGQIHHSEEKTMDGKRNMGIGLSACRTIVQAHGGMMHASNPPEGGACLQFELPMEEIEYGDP